jgi:hypothetical protein
MRICRIILAALMAVLPASALAQESPQEPCTVSTSLEGRLNDLMDQWTDFNVPETVALCEQLKAAGAGLWITYDSGELEGRSFGWVIIALDDRATGVTASATYNATTLTEDLGVEAQDYVLRTSLEHALRSLAADSTTYVEGLRNDVAAMRLAHGR